MTTWRAGISPSLPLSGPQLAARFIAKNAVSSALAGLALANAGWHFYPSRTARICHQSGPFVRLIASRQGPAVSTLERL